MENVKINDIGVFIRYAGLKNIKEYQDACKKVLAAHPEMMDQWIGFVIGFDNYADGVCGTNYYGGWVTPNHGTDFKGFDRKGDVRRKLKDFNIKVGYMRKTRYGHRGWDKVYVMRVKDAIDWYHRNNSSGGNYRVYFANGNCY